MQITVFKNVVINVLQKHSLETFKSCWLDKMVLLEEITPHSPGLRGKNMNICYCSMLP